MSDTVITEDSAEQRERNLRKTRVGEVVSDAMDRPSSSAP